MGRSSFLGCLIAIGVLAASCSGPAPTPEPDRVATRVAEEFAIAATLTAAAPKNAPPAPAVPATPTPTLEAVIPTATPMPAAAPTAAPPTEPPSAPLCRVLSSGLNLRSGPGVVFNPPLEALPQGTEMQPRAFVGAGFPAGQWIEVQVVASGRRGWVSAGQQFVACNVDVGTLPPGVPPPTPLLPTPTRVQPPTIVPPGPPPPSLVQIVPVDGSDGNKSLGNDRGVNQGRNIVLPGFDPSQVSKPLTFHDRVVFRVEVFDRNYGRTDGAGIDSVTFTITDETGSVVHRRTERTPGYCVFGGGEPDCTVWRFSQNDDKWPGGAALQPGLHDVQILIKPQSSPEVTWFWSFRIEK